MDSGWRDNNLIGKLDARPTSTCGWKKKRAERNQFLRIYFSFIKPKHLAQFRGGRGDLKWTLIKVICRFHQRKLHRRKVFCLAGRIKRDSMRKHIFTFEFGFHFGFRGTLGFVSSGTLLLVLFGGRISGVAPLKQLEKFALLAGHNRLGQLGILLPYGEIRFPFLFLCRIGRHCGGQKVRSRR